MTSQLLTTIQSAVDKMKKEAEDLDGKEEDKKTHLMRLGSYAEEVSSSVQYFLRWGDDGL